MSTIGMTRRGLLQSAAAGLLTGCYANSALAQIAPDAEKALHEAARQDGELTWYVSHYSAENAERYARAFSRKYPGINCNVVRTTTHVAHQRLMQELKSGGPQVDVLSVSDISHYLELSSKGLLDKFVPANEATMLPVIRGVDPNGTFVVTSYGAIGLGIRADKVKVEDAPKNWMELLDLRWKNQIALAHPAFSGAGGIWTWQMARLYGWEFFERLKANNPQIGRSLLDPVTTIKSGERTIAVANLASLGEATAAGEPITALYPADGVQLIFSPSAVVKGCKHPLAARLFVEFMTSEDASRISVSHSSESKHDSVPSRSLRPLSELKTLTADPVALLKGIPEIKEKWRDTFGV